MSPLRCWKVRSDRKATNPKAIRELGTGERESGCDTERVVNGLPEQPWRLGGLA